MSDRAAENLRRLLAERGISIRQLAARTGLDQRTIRGILTGTSTPHVQTLHRVADAFGVAVDELFLDPSHLLYRRFDRHTNPLVDEIFQAHRGLFADWVEADFDELHSRVGAGGALTFEGALAVVHHMNHKRELHEKLDLLLESSQAEVIRGIMEVLYAQVSLGTPQGDEFGE